MSIKYSMSMLQWTLSAMTSKIKMAAIVGGLIVQGAIGEVNV